MESQSVFQAETQAGYFSIELPPLAVAPELLSSLWRFDDEDGVEPGEYIHIYEITCTGRPERMTQRKWRESKQQLM